MKIIIILAITSGRCRTSKFIRYTIRQLQHAFVDKVWLYSPHCESIMYNNVTQRCKYLNLCFRDHSALQVGLECSSGCDVTTHNLPTIAFCGSQIVYLMNFKGVRPEPWPPFWLDFKPADIPALWPGDYGCMHGCVGLKSWTIPLRIIALVLCKWFLSHQEFSWSCLVCLPLVFLREDRGSGAGGQDGWARCWNLPEGWLLHQRHARTHCGDQRTHSRKCLWIIFSDNEYGHHAFQ